jgi:hypothetical protein
MSLNFKLQKDAGKTKQKTIEILQDDFDKSNGGGGGGGDDDGINFNDLDDVNIADELDMLSSEDNFFNFKKTPAAAAAAAPPPPPQQPPQQQQRKSAAPPPRRPSPPPLRGAIRRPGEDPGGRDAAVTPGKP